MLGCEFRLFEDLYVDMFVVVVVIVDDLLLWLECFFVFFGYSLGLLMLFCVVCEFCECGVLMLLYMFFFVCCVLYFVGLCCVLYGLLCDELLCELCSLEGMLLAVFEYEELLELLLFILCVDF